MRPTRGPFWRRKSSVAGRRAGTPKAIAAALPIALGVQLSKLIPGRISTEVEANLSFDTDASVSRALEIVEAYAARGVGTDRILIKLAATWEGIRAAEVLQKQGIDCNLTLIFSLTQAIASADAGAFLISPFVGRITDWFKKAEGVDSYAAGLPPLKWSSAMFRKTEEAHGKQATEARRNCHEVTAS